MNSFLRSPLYRWILIFLFVGLMGYRLFSPQVALLNQDMTTTIVENDFSSYITQVKGVKKIQVAELEQMEMISEESRKKILWNRLELPKVVVAVSVPVQYVYTVDLEKKWEILNSDWQILVKAPGLEFNKPAADVSQLNMRVEKSSVLRNENEVAKSLIGKLSEHLNSRAIENKDVIREQARKQVQDLIKLWLDSQNEPAKPIQVTFADEVPNSHPETVE